MTVDEGNVRQNPAPKLKRIWTPQISHFFKGRTQEGLCIPKSPCFPSLRKRESSPFFKGRKEEGLCLTSRGITRHFIGLGTPISSRAAAHERGCAHSKLIVFCLPHQRHPEVIGIQPSPVSFQPPFYNLSSRGHVAIRHRSVVLSGLNPRMYLRWGSSSLPPQIAALALAMTF